MSSHANVTEHLRSLRLPDARAEYMRQLSDASYNALGFSERLDLVLSAEMSARRTRRIQRRIREPNLRVSARKEEFYFDTDQGITRAELAELASLSFMASGRGVIISGATGCGKTYLACILGTEAATRELTVRYHRTSELIERLARARVEGNMRSVLSFYRKLDLLLLDDFGLSAVPVSASRELLEILDERSESASTVIASQFPPESFPRLIEDPTAADAICDRITAGAIVVSLTGESMRRLKSRAQVADVGARWQLEPTPRVEVRTGRHSFGVRIFLPPRLSRNRPIRQRRGSLGPTRRAGLPSAG